MSVQTADKYALLKNTQQELWDLSAEELEAVLRFIKALHSENDQGWYWSAEWQAMEEEADQDLADGDYEEFETVDDFIASL
ncbi:MAG: hypothetical protein KDJ65_01575 [Anaerolineae bacterium]|nr:hypothetical protein [Anaerolineae bacterium]